MTKSAHTDLDVRKFILNCKPSPNKERNWRLGDAVLAGVHPAQASAPPSVDLRATWWHVGDQGSTGSCVGWGTAEGVLRWHFAHANRLAQTTRLSPRYVWMAAKETDQYVSRPTSFIESDGTWLTAALDVARKLGVVTERVLPFENLPGSGELYLGSETAFYATAATRKIASYFNLGTSLTDWRNWIANHGPILTRLDVDTTWDNCGPANQGKLLSYDAAHTRGGHCVSLVGYTPDHFIVRNSWGTTWGDGGFGYASNAYASAAFTEAYGVTL